MWKSFSMIQLVKYSRIDVTIAPKMNVSTGFWKPPCRRYSTSSAP